MTRKKVALVLTGGGARGAYQAGILKSWEHLFKQGGKIEIISGFSAGSVNTLLLTENTNALVNGVDAMIKLWLSLHPTDIYDANFRAIVKNTFNLIRSSRRIEKGSKGNILRAFLDSMPLYHFLNKHVDFDKIHQQLKSNPELALVVNCFNYTNMKNVAFFQTESNIPGWERPNRIGLPTKINAKHILASCSVPIIFAPVNIGGSYYGDGTVRNIAPLNPAIQLGADRIICISMSGLSANLMQGETPSLGNIAEAIFDSMSMDAVEYDSKILNRINVLSNQIPGKKRDYRMVELCTINPQLNFGTIVAKFNKRFPKSVRYLLGGWLSPELMSFLLFDGEFSEYLIDKGYEDGKLYIETVEKWLLDT